MNASVRREGSGVRLGRPASPARNGIGAIRRRHAIRRAFLTGIALTAPVVAAAAPPPSAPLPPTLPVAEKPANMGLFSKVPKPSATQTQPAAGQATAEQADARAAMPQPAAAEPVAAKPAASSWNPLGSWSPSQSLTSLWPTRAPADARPTDRAAPAAKTADKAAPAAKTADKAAPAARRTDPSPKPSPVAKGVVVTSPAATGGGRFDPDLGPAGHFVSDSAAPMPAGRPDPRDDAAFLDSAPVFTAAATGPAPAAVGGEPVSLVSWLSKSYADYVATSGPDDPAGDCPAVCVTDRCCPTWQIQTDALFLWQGNIPSRSLYIDTATQETVLDASQLQNRAAIAPRYAIIYNRDDCRAIEVNYFQVWGFNASASVGTPAEPVLNAAGDGALSIDNLLGLSYDSIGYARAQSSAHIKSFELNMRKRHCDGMVQWISGFRWLEWGQGLYLQDIAYSYTQPGQDGNPPGGTDVAGGDAINITTLNNLYGWQWGGDMTLWNAGRWMRINGIGKAGVYYNHQALQNTAYSINGGPSQTFADSKDTVSFVGETGINASWALTSWLSWRAGYSFFWLSGMAVPARQLSLTDVNEGTTSVNATGSVFVHGATTGLEARW